MSWVTITLIILTLVVIFGPVAIKNIYSKKLTTLLMNRDFDGFDALVDKKIVTWSINPFNIDYMKLNKALMKNDPKEIDEVFKVFDSRKLNDKQKEAVYYNGFYYYMAQENKPLTTKYVKELLKMEKLPEEAKEDIRVSYDININGSYNLLDDTLKKLKDEKDPQLITKYELMIAKMYANKGDDAKAKEYMDRFIDRSNNLKS